VTGRNVCDRRRGRRGPVDVAQGAGGVSVGAGSVAAGVASGVVVGDGVAAGGGVGA